MRVDANLLTPTTLLQRCRFRTLEMSADYMVQYRCAISGFVTSRRLMVAEEVAAAKRAAADQMVQAEPVREGARTRVG